MPRKEISPGIWVNVPDTEDTNIEEKSSNGNPRLIAPSENPKLIAPDVNKPLVGPVSVPSSGGMDGKYERLAEAMRKERAIEAKKEKERKSTPEYLKDRDAFENHLRINIFPDKGLMKELTGSTSFTSIENNDDFSDIRKRVKEDLGIKGWFQKDDRSRYMNLTEEDLDNALDQVFAEQISNEKYKANQKQIDFAIKKIVESGEDVTTKLSEMEDVDINSLSRLEKEMATIQKKLRSPGDLSKQELIALNKRAQEIANDDQFKPTLYGALSGKGSEFKFFINPVTGNNLSEEEAIAYSKNNPPPKDISQDIKNYKSELSTIKDIEKLTNTYNDINLSLHGHRNRGSEKGDYWIDNEGIGNILEEKGYERLKPGDEGYQEALKKLTAERKKEGFGMYGTMPRLFKDLPLSEVAQYADRFKGGGMVDGMLAGVGSDNFIKPVYSDPGSWMGEQTFEDYLVRYSNAGYDLVAQKIAMKDIYLLNQDPSTIRKNHLATLSEAAVGSIMGEKYTQRELGFSNRKILDLTKEITDETGILLNPEQELTLERSLGDDISEGVGGAASILVQLAALNKVQGVATGIGAIGRIMTASKAVRYFKNGKHLSQASIAARARVLGITEQTYATKYGFKAVQASRAAKTKGHLINIMFEEAKMAGALDFDLGTGAGFYAAGAAMPFTFTGEVGKQFNFTSKYNQWNTARNMVFKNSTSFALGTKFGGLVESSIHDLMNDKTITAHLEETYGDYDALQRGVIVDLALGSLFGATHLKSMDIKRTSDIKKIKDASAKKYEEAILDGDVDAMSKHQEIYNQAKQRLDALDKIDLYTNPATARSAYEKLTGGLKKAFKGKLDVEVVENGKNMDNKDAQGEYVNSKNTKNGNGKLIINLENANPGVIPHEGIHAGMDILFDGDIVLKQKFQRKLENIADQVKLEGGESLKDLIMREKSISEFKKPEELMAYMAEYLAKAEYYTQLVSNNAFSNIKQHVQRFSESKLNSKPRLVTTQDVVNFLGRYVESVKKGYNPIKQLERLKEMVELAEAGPNLQKNDASIKLEKSKLLEQNKKLIENKPEGWREANKVISEKVRKLNNLIEKSNMNEVSIKKYAELTLLENQRGATESTRLRKSRAFEQLRETNQGILNEFIKEAYTETPGSNVTRRMFTEEVMNGEFLRNVNSYLKKGDFNVPFGAYLRNNLFGPYFKPGSGKPQRQGNVLKRIQQGRNQDADVQTMSMSDPNVFKAAEGMEIMSGGARNIPEKAIEANEGIRLVRDLDVTPKQVKQIESKLNDMLSNPKKVANLDFKSLKDLAPDLTIELFGGKGFAAKTKQAKADFIGKNWRTLYELLPLGASPITGKATGVSTSLQTSLKTGGDVFYTKGKDVKFADTGNATGLPIQMKIKMGKDAFLEKLGIETKFEEGANTKEVYDTSKMDRNHETIINNLIKEAGRNISNQVVRDYLTREKYEENPKLAEELAREQLIHNIASGKSETLASIDLLSNRLKNKLNIEVNRQDLIQIMGGFKYRTLDEMQRSMGKEKFAEIKDWIEETAVIIANEGKTALQYVKSVKGKEIPGLTKNTEFWKLSDAKFKESPKAKKWFEKSAFDIAAEIPLGDNAMAGNMKVILDLFAGHYNVVGSDYAKVESAFKKGIKENLSKNGTQDYMSNKTLERWKNFDFDALRTSYASSFYTGMKKINAEPDQLKKKELALEYFNSKDGKQSIELYDLWNTTLQEWIGKETKGSAEYWNKADYILKIKKANSAIGTTGERILAPGRYVYLPKGVVEGTIKFEHLKSSSEQSAESALLLLSGQWKTKGKKGLRNYGGIYGMLSDFNIVDKATGKVNNSDIFRLSKNLELAKDIYSIESNFKRSLYDDILAEVGKEAVNQIKVDGKNATKDAVLQSLRLGKDRMPNGKRKRKGISVFDFDDTLARTNSQIIVTMPSGKTMKINATEFAKQDAALTKKGAKYDFSEFNQVIDGKKGPLFDLAMKRQDKFTNKDIFVLTARPAESAIAIHKFLKGIGLEVPIKNITGLENGAASAKADWILEKAKEGYNDFYFADDAYKNVKAVKDVLDVIDVKGRVEQALASKNLNKDINDIIESKFGTKSEAVYSKVKADKLGSKANKTKIIPYSHQDFLGLMYPMLGKGKKGDAQLKWVNDNFVRPFSRAELSMTSDRIQLTSRFREIKQRLRGTIPKNLRKEAVEGFTFSDVIRVVTWNKQGMEIPGISKADLKTITDFADVNPKIKEFSQELIQLNLGNGYPKPGEQWAKGESITTDLLKSLNEGRRAEYLSEWQQNVDQVFSVDNLNKMEAKLGNKWRESMDNMLERMKTGRNRTFKGGQMGKLESQFTDWVNNSIGTIMFFNTRSAVLQTISNINYVNFSDNNPLKAGKALANQPQYWKDVMEIMNSDYLVNRRGGLKINVSESEIADAANAGSNKFKGALNYILKKGFLPTQYADSFAISTGGATFYRNRIKTYEKQGLSKAEAKERAFSDFQTITETSQQSSRADMISMQQASTLGRLVLAFGNTPSQYARIMNKAGQDLLAGRGDYKTNISKIIYYGAVQNFMFNALQNALFKLMFDEDDDEKASQRDLRIANGMLDSVLRGTGVVGAGVSTAKNMIMEFIKQSEKKNPKYADVALKLLDIAPPVDSKISKLRSAGLTLDYDMKEIKSRGFSLDNPAWLAGGKVTSALTNIPLDRLFKKYNNLSAALEDDTENWQAIALSLGWSEWELGMSEKEKNASAKRFIYNKRKKSGKKRLIAPKN